MTVKHIHEVHVTFGNKLEIEAKGDSNLTELILSLITKTHKIMASVEELDQKVVDLQASIDAKQEQITAAIAAFKQTIVDLQAQIATGGATAEQLQAIADKVDAAKTDLESTSTE